MRVPNASLNNLKRAVLERVFFVSRDENGKWRTPPKPDSKLFYDRMDTFKVRMERKLVRASPVTHEQFVGMYQGRKRTIYQNALNELNATGFKEKYGYLKNFLKAEKTNITSKPNFVPRVISPRSPCYNVELGSFLKPMEERVYRAINKVFGEKTVMKGYNAAKLGGIAWKKWSKYQDPVAVGLDASRFDQHVSSVALEWEHSVYVAGTLGGRNRKWLKKLLKMQLHNRCFGNCNDGAVTYSTDGGRASGDMNTALGNCLIMCAMIYSYGLFKGVKLSLMNNGDDCVVFMERKDLNKFSDGLREWFLQMGFDMKVEPPFTIMEEIEFCQMHPVWTPDGYLFVRNAQTGLAKDAVSIDPLRTPIEVKGWLKAVGMGGMALAGGIPIYQDHYKRYLDTAGGVKPRVTTRVTGLEYYAKNMKREYGTIHPRTRASFYWAFGITPDMQCEIERYYQTHPINVEHRLSGEWVQNLPEWF